MVVRIRKRDFEVKKPVVLPKVDLTPVERIVDGLGVQIKAAAEEVKEAIHHQDMANVKVIGWDFAVKRDRGGRLSSIQATATKFSDPRQLIGI